MRDLNSVKSYVQGMVKKNGGKIYDSGRPCDSDMFSFNWAIAASET